MISPHGPTETGELVDKAVTQAKMNVFISAEQIGTGAEQEIAHGLGATPAFVFIALTEFGAAENPNVSEGTHNSTNVKVTVASATVKFKVVALAP